MERKLLLFSEQTSDTYLLGMKRKQKKAEVVTVDKRRRRACTGSHTIFILTIFHCFFFLDVCSTDIRRTDFHSFLELWRNLRMERPKRTERIKAQRQHKHQAGSNEHIDAPGGHSPHSAHLIGNTRNVSSSLVGLIKKKKRMTLQMSAVRQEYHDTFEQHVHLRCTSDWLRRERVI